MNIQNLRLFGTIVNVLAILLGCALGLLVKKLAKGKKEPSEKRKELTDAIFRGMGICVFAIGVAGVIKCAVNGQILSALEGSYVGSAETPLVLAKTLSTERTLVVILSMALGALTGHLLDLDRRIHRLGERIEEKVKNRFGRVAEGFVTATLLFCVGSMTIVGSLDSGLYRDHTILITKATIDFVSAIVLTLSLGVGVGFSIFPVFLLQGGITLLAGALAPILSQDMIAAISEVGCLLLIVLSFDMMGVKKIKVMNYMPAVLFPLGLVPLADWIAKL